ncbi:hypothetical protein BO78DRAFT_468512 [Aspergillus sclerotiicarbonarius CBS 121057]|uniref:RHS repeat protein n=1 Tax=Aspergillus sclerotiicarbonarius (strain CBS 121057 / IBT 28362) TaxID=1448318 RepID=A0A319EGA7_ASPSB|nr:hypothetical protein BO78DRAFT_468512 [Aspergillus sclerotiicarbonarius CBS 121057]
MIYSQGFNFNTYIEKGVDPRTGQYNCAIALYEVPASVRNCPPFNLSLNYNPLNSEDVGLGKGWSFGNLSSYDHRTGKTLVLSTGENYKVTETSSSVFMTDQKLKSFVFQKTGTYSYRVALKSGQVEVLSNLNNVYKTSVPTNIYGANGRSLQLSWVRSGEQPRLSKVQADSQDLVVIDYADAQTTITRAPGTAEAATFTLVKRNSQLDAGFSLPNGASIKSIPYVISHTARPFQNQPAIQTTYSYSDYNFLGYGGGRNWTDGEDNLYLTPAAYEYSATVQVVGGTTTKHTYNKFHLLVSTQQQKGTKQVTQTTTYYALSNTAFANQPAQYQAPKTQQTTYRDTSTGASRTETTQFTFDDWGNVTSETPPSGVTTTREYYALAGETGCPADPHGFQRYLKLETVTPAASAYQTPTRAHRYTYLELPTTADALTTYCVAAQQRQTIEEGRTLSTTDYTYVNQSQSQDHGRLQQQVTRLLDQYSTTFDGQTTQEETTSSLVSGLTLATKDRAGVTTTQQHDAMGRVTQTTAAPGTAFEAIKKHEYTVLADTVGWRVTVTDTKGVQTRYFTDGLDRVVRVESQDDDGSWDQYNAYTGTFRVIRERRYNALGQCSEEAEIDWLRASGTPTEQRTTRSLAYDDWGQLYKVTPSSGAVQLSETDPIALTRTVGIEGEGQTRTQYNAFNTPASQALVRRNGTVESTVAYAYDGLGRRMQMTDGLGRATQYSYDSFDRVVQTTWPDSHAIATQYAAHSAAALPVAINLSGTTGFSEQAFDGLERSLGTTVGGRTTSNTYQGVAPVPAQVTNPQGGRSQRTYEPALNYALTGRVTSDGTDAYQYDKQTGDVLQLGSSLATADLSYYPSSLLSQETIQTVSGAHAVQYVYSQAGKLQDYTDVHGQQHVIQYDASGRRREMRVGTLQTTLTYDQADRVITSVVQDTSQSVALTTNLEYDDFGREIQRTVWTGTKKWSQATQAYDATGLVTARNRSDGNGTVTRQETFQYDSLSRLVDYQCQGTQPPVDEQGRGLRRQRFTLNGYDGLTQIQTTFADGSVNTQTYTYSAQDPTQLIRITNTHADEPAEIHLEYDANGCLTRDEHGRTLVYNASRLLAAVYDGQNQLLCEYGYDASDRLVRQTVANEPVTQLSYRGDTLIAVTKGERQTNFGSDGGQYWGEIYKQGSQVQTNLWASDAHHSVSIQLNPQAPDQVHDQAYTPYGSSSGSSSSSSSAIGFNGQWRDSVTGWYHLGSGRRVYNPSLKLFLQPDSWSPFTSGEISPYAYCLGDPINRADPSGHLSWRGLAQFAAGLTVGIALTVFTAGTGIAVGLVASIAIGAVVNATAGAAYDLATGTTPTLKSVGIDAFYGAIGGFTGGVVDGAATSWGSSALYGIAQTVAYSIGLEAVSLASSYLTQSQHDIVASLPFVPSRTTMTLQSLDPVQNSVPNPSPLLESAGNRADDAVSARTTSRQTVTNENIRVHSSTSSTTTTTLGVSFDATGSRLTLQLTPDHRVSFTINTQPAHVPVWDLTGSLSQL